MIHELKVFGAVLAAVLTVGALAASAAVASNFHTYVEKTNLSAGQVGTHYLVVNTGVIVCEEVSFSGTKVGATTATISLTPAYGECEFQELFGVSVSVNECEYVFDPIGTMAIEGCNSEAAYIQVGSLATCRVRIGEQGLAAVTYTVEGNNIELSFELALIFYSESGLFCAGGETKMGTYGGSSTLTADGGEDEIWVE